MEENNIISSARLSESSDKGLIHIEGLIHIIRGQQVMLDSDLARLYGVETKYLKRAVKVNIKRFPSDFMFELAPSEFNSLRCKNCTSNEKSQRGGTRYMPFVFTEQGIAMLSGVLKSDTAIEVNIRIMRAFIAMRSFIMSNATIFQRLETVEHHQLLMQEHQSETEKKIEEILTRLDDKEAEPIEGFFYEGQIFDAYTLISDLVRMAHTRIILIDNYVDDRVLKTLDKRKEGVTATVFTNPRNSQISLDIKRHNAQYPEISLRHCTNVHDRFLIIDDTVYFIGGSIKDLGKKIVAFSQMHQSPNDIISKLR
ncbi:MAG: ORF6N domain-containing protein [Bacteroidales bacterium]|nr:ORF6N domain-containing protein [Bacteroidales bacterium]